MKAKLPNRKNIFVYFHEGEAKAVKATKSTATICNGRFIRFDTRPSIVANGFFLDENKEVYTVTKRNILKGFIYANYKTTKQAAETAYKQYLNECATNAAGTAAANAGDAPTAPGEGAQVQPPTPASKSRNKDFKTVTASNWDEISEAAELAAAEQISELYNPYY